MKLVYLGFLSALTLASCAHAPEQAMKADTYPPAAHEPPMAPAPSSEVEVNGANGVHGTMVFKDEGEKIHVLGEFSGLKPNSVHGIHVHENGSCDGEKFAGAGGHFNPWKTQHGSDASKMRHAGDLGNITADANGNAKLDIRIPGGPDLRTFGGKAVILHAKVDDEKSQPAGNSGDKIACGLVKEKK